jgi:hypothetical protein
VNPCDANAIANVEVVDLIADGFYSADNLMPRDDGISLCR